MHPNTNHTPAPLRAITLVATCGLALALAAAAAAQDQNQNQNNADDVMPIRTISLYRSGVGYFERRGMVQGDEEVGLRFSTEQVNDILKSMVVLDLGGGSIGAITYGSNLPLDRRLASFGVDVSKAPSVERLFKQLAGEAVEVETSGGVVTGTILSVEDRPTPVTGERGDGFAMSTQPYVNLVTSSGIQAVGLYDLRSFELQNKELAGELSKALSVLAQYRAERTTTVDVELLGAGDRARPVVIGYMHEMPVWKTSYRLVLPEDSGASDDGATLQGWAIVENTTDADWEGVKLSLASGRPVSFTMDLYRSIFTQRPELPVPVGGGLLPTLYEAGKAVLRDAMPADRAAGEAELRMRKPARPSSGGGMAGMFQDDWDANAEYKSDMSGYIGQSQGSGEQVGGQFMYTVDAPVTLARQQSAMLPILVDSIPCQRISIYNPSDQQGHPMRGAKMTNDSGLHLMPGPIAVYDTGNYAGDSQIPHVARNQDQILTYALDIDVQASSEAKVESDLRSIRISDGMLMQTWKQRRDVTYSFKNLDAKSGRRLIVEHNKSGSGWELVTKDGLDETTDSAYRFAYDIAPSGEADATIREERTTHQSAGVLSIPLETLLAYRNSGKLSKAVLDAVQQAAQMQADINDMGEQITRLNQERSEIFQDQGRLRDNMGRISTSSDLYQRYMEKLGKQETRIEQIMESVDRIENDRAKAQQAMQDYLRDLDVE